MQEEDKEATREEGIKAAAERIRQNELRALRHERYWSPRSVFVSFPRSGRTWVQHMLYHVQVKCLPDKFRGVLSFQHDACRYEPTLNATRNRRDLYLSKASSKNGFRGRHVVQLVRHPCDVVVSLWYGTHFRKGFKLGRDISSFFRSDIGLPWCVRWMNDWEAARWAPARMCRMQYELNLSAPGYQLLALCQWLRIPQVTREVCEEAAELCTIENLRAYDVLYVMPGDVKRWGLSQDAASDLRYHAVRTCRAGGWQEELDQETRSWAEKHLKDNLDKVYGYE
jgi:hypothetical protein